MTLSPEIQPCDHLNDGQSNREVIPLILTYNPINHHVKNILSRNFDLLKSDPETKELFDNSRVLGAYRRDTNLRDSLVSSNLQSGAERKCKTLQPHGINIDFNFICANSSSAHFECCHI